MEERVSTGYPGSMVALLRCPLEGAELVVARAASTSGAGPDERLVRAELSCTSCGRIYPIVDGIVNLLLELPEAIENAYEMQRRDEKIDEIQRRGGKEWSSPFADSLEVAPTLAALGSTAGLLVAELGCGSGRYTERLLRDGHRVIAIDFSRASLALLGTKVDAAPLGLVWADVTRLRLAPGAFDGVLSTLHSNLLTREHRMAAVRLAAEAVKDEGRFVFSMHFYGLREWLVGTPRAGQYADSGIFRYYMDAREARREAQPYFARLRFAPIAVSIPGLPLLLAARIAQRTPVVRGLGRLLLAVAEGPRRPPIIGHVSSWSRRVATWIGGAKSGP
jgi:SAM-dependent methyltransferase